MKVVQIITSGEKLYGAQKHVLTLCKYLTENGHEVILVVGIPGELSDAAAMYGIKVIILKNLIRPINPVQDYLCYYNLKNIIRSIQPDLVAAHSSKAGIIARIVAFKLRIPSVFTAHGWSFADGIPPIKRNIFKILERVVGSISDSIIAVSQADKELAIKYNIASERKIRVINYGIDELPKSNLPEVRSKAFTMIMSARFNDQKDHASLIRSLPLLKNPDWNLILMGDGPLQRSIEELTNEMGISDKVVFLGMVSDVRHYIDQADIVLLITNWEGLPISIIEALSLGKPVIATRVAGIPEQIQHGVNGYLIDHNAPQQISSYIDTLIADDILTKKFGKASRVLFEKKFSLNQMVEKTMNEYNILVNSSKNS